MPGLSRTILFSRRLRAFTMVEIMVVVVIIGLLAAAGIPTYRHITMRSKVTALENDLRLFSTAIQTYTLQNGHWPANGDPQVVPPELANSLPSNFIYRTPIGGVYKWNYDVSADGITAKAPVRGARSAGQSTSPLRSIAEVLGLFAVAVVLVAVGLRFGLPQKRLSDVPDDVTIVTSSAERASVFATVAGSYSTGKTAGNSLVIIQPDGRVLLGAIGKDGKPTPPRIAEQARAGRRGNIACVITSFGIIAGIAPPDTINVGRFQYKKAAVSVQ